MNVTYIQLHGINYQVMKTKSLYFDGKDLTSFPGQINILKGLSNLRIYSRFIKEIPQLMLPNLRELEIDAPLDRFPDFSKCIELRKIVIKNAKIKEIPVIRNYKMEVIKLSNLGIEEFKGGLLKKLITLDISKNNIKVIPECFKKFRGLNELNLSHNPIEVLPDLRELKWLKELELEGVEYQKFDWLLNIIEE